MRNRCCTMRTAIVLSQTRCAAKLPSNPRFLWPKKESMAVEIGASHASFHENPIQLMSDCHRRIERFLYVVITIKRAAQGGPLNQEQRTALGAALLYFREAAPWHTL